MPRRDLGFGQVALGDGLDSGTAFSPGGALRSILPFITTTIVTTREARWKKHRPAGNKREPPFLHQGQVVPRLLAGGANRSDAHASLCRNCDSCFVMLFLFESFFLVRRCMPRALPTWAFLSFGLSETEGSVL